MIPQIWMNLLAAALIGGVFFLSGSRLKVFSLLYIVIAGGAAAVSFFWGDPGHNIEEVILLGIGYLLLFIGLILAGAMIQRSITLHAISSIARNEDPRPVIQEGINARIEEAYRLNFVNNSENRLYLNRQGKVLGVMAGIAYSLFRLK
ncbi:hypothetical protein ACFLT9_12985 [Acidobacteriota bacterium]